MANIDALTFASFVANVVDLFVLFYLLLLVFGEVVAVVLQN